MFGASHSAIVTSAFLFCSRFFRKNSPVERKTVDKKNVHSLWPEFTFGTLAKSKNAFIWRSVFCDVFNDAYSGYFSDQTVLGTLREKLPVCVRIANRNAEVMQAGCWYTNAR